MSADLWLGLYIGIVGTLGVLGLIRLIYSVGRSDERASRR